jgi:RNA polymerase primary sigma factor
VPISLETPIGEEEESTLADLIADAAARAPSDEAEEGVLADMLDEALKRHLTPREAQVLRMRFGLDDGQVRTLGEVGDELEISRERARQIEAEAIRKLRTTVPFMKQFRDYVE